MSRVTVVSQVIVSGVALVLIYAHLERHLDVDPTTGGLLLIAALPWLRNVFKSVSAFGWKVELRELKREVQNAKGEAASANLRSQYAAAGREGSTDASQGSSTSSAGNVASGLEAIAKRYDTFREANKGKAGEARTRQMTLIVREMTDMAKADPQFDPSRLLKSKSFGSRLAAYAALYVYPRPDLLSDLIEVVAGDGKQPFVQYWGILAIGEIVAAIDYKVSSSQLASLQSLNSQVPIGTDRSYELAKILRSIKGGHSLFSAQ